MEQTEIESTDAYRELGYLPPEEIGEVRKTIRRMEDRGVGPDQMREKNLKLLKEVWPDLQWEGTGSITLEVVGTRTPCKIDFHPASNTFFSQAKQQFGHGIEEQVRKIQQYLKGKKA